ncbi:MAG: OmpA family protein [Bacteroidetes bacterium]|nr:OmpA family protein [Bacteroidota bacterium]
MPKAIIFAKNLRYTLVLKKIGFILISILLLAAPMSMAQQKSLCPPTTSKKAEKYFEDAREARKNKKTFSVVKEYCEKALAEDSVYADALKLLGDFAWQSRQDKAMAIAYERLLTHCPDASSDAHYRLANYLYEQKEYEKSIIYFQSFLDFNKVKEENAKDASQKITRAKLMMKPVPFKPVPLANISSADPEYLAIISPDQDFCFFTRRFEEQKRGSLFPASVEKFMISKKIESSFEKGEPMPFPFNKAGSNNEGGASITIDNKHLFFTVNKNGNFDIYTSDENKGIWSEPRSVGAGVNHPDRWESQPCISPDGKTLYFVSIRDSLNPTSDIYFSKRAEDGNWGAMKSIGSNINTPGSEKTPFIHPDNKTLYFSSDNLPGMGGYDIFMCRLNADGSWGTPVNLGYPINTEADELGFFVSTDGKKGYFSSNSLKGVGGYDIYEFELYNDIKPDRVLFIKGELKDENNVIQKLASIELKNVNTKQNAEVAFDSTTGKYASVVLFDEDYILTIKKQGYAYNSAYFSSKDSTRPEPVKVDMKLSKTKTGSAYRLNNILFDTESSSLTEQDKIILSDFAEYLRENPGLKVAVHGHTDNLGDPSKNLQLSEDRARSVCNFLIQAGVAKERLSSKGFGETKPIEVNSNADGRAKNRRTEFVVVSQ